MADENRPVSEEPRVAGTEDAGAGGQADGEQEKEWSNGLFSCNKECETFCKGLFCPCIAVGNNAEKLGEDFLTWCAADFLLRLLLFDVPFVGHMAIRMKLREKKRIKGSVLKDFVATCFCFPCALVQESLELQGENENMERS